ncbi:MAG TPA: histidine phosphatase family protein [Stellaceae bacterium]|nr:histidine phosphatase family protein [Stellaceae bacterium]
MSQTSRDSGQGMLSPFGAGAIGAGATGATATTTRFWWVRHAPVAHEGRIYGQKDMPCDCSDTTVFTGLARQLPRDAVWVTSHLRRTYETAQAIVRAGLPGPDPIPGPDAAAIPDLAEQSFGEWQGLTYEELRESRAGAFHRFWHAPAHERAPGGESFIDVMQRVAQAIHRLLEPHRGHDIIAVAHGGTIRAGAGSGTRPRTRSLPRLHDGKLLGDPHRPYRRTRHGAWLAGRHGQPSARRASRPRRPGWRHVVDAGRPRSALTRERIASRPAAC